MPNGGERGRKDFIAMKTDFETAKSILERELKDAPYVKDNLLGNAASSRKVMDFVIAAINSNMDRAKCLGDLRKILEENDVDNVYSTTYDTIVGLLFEILERYKR